MPLNREELILLAGRIIKAEGETEEENDSLLDQFLDNVPDPNAADYFYDTAYEDLSAEDIVDKALAYKPIQL